MPEPLQLTSEQRQKILAHIMKFRLIDDAFLRICFKDYPEGVQFILRIILDMDDIIVRSVETQSDFKNLSGHSLTMDVVAEDSRGKRYDIEIQRANEGATAARASYHSAVLEANSLPAGVDFAEKSETYVIFLTENDVWKQNRPIYHIKRMIEEAPAQEFHDKVHIIYVNYAYKSESNEKTALEWMIHDFLCTRAAEMHYEALAARVRYFKESEKGVTNMCEITEAIKEEGRAEGREKTMITSVKNLMQTMNLSLTQALDALLVPQDIRPTVIAAL